MAAPTVYRWDDTDAPVARGERTSFIEILTACLVTGYGSKTAAGWTKEFTNAEGTVAAFRNNPTTGTGFFFRVDNLISSYVYEVRVDGFEIMTDENTGNGKFTKVAADRYFNISNAINTTARPWILFADDRTFHFFVWNTITTQPVTTDIQSGWCCFGDILPINQNDSYGCMVGAAMYGLPSLASPQSNVTSENYHSVSAPRPSDGSVSACTMALCYGGGPLGHTTAMGMGGPPYTEGGHLFYSRPHLADGAPQTIRGYVPGLYYPCHPDKIGQWREMVMENGQNMMMFSGYVGGGNNGQWMISLDDWGV